jgi:hypothetical protein
VANVFRTCDDVDVVELAEDELVARSPDRTHAMVLNATASAVLELCNGEHTASDMARFLHDTLPTSELSKVEGDVDAILRELCEAGIVTAAEP